MSNENPELRVADVPTDESPIESARSRLLRVGGAALTDPELLALLTRPAGGATAAARLLASCGGLKTLVTNLPRNQSRFPGFGEGRIALLLAAMELSRRVMSSTTDRPTLSTPKQVYEYLAPSLQALRREVFHVLCLNNRNTLLLDARIAEGSVSSCPVDPREVFSTALSSGASSIIVAHNHPSGSLDPSSDDITLTNQLAEAGRFLHIRLLDHIIVSDGGFTSFSERGLLPPAHRSRASKP
jgi:DNA repair protein RadC